MGKSVTWRGNVVGAWNAAQNWSGFAVPDITVAVIIGAGTAEIAAGVTAAAASLAMPGGTLLLDAGAVLQVAGTLALTGGTLDLAGTLVGGTLTAGTLAGQGGTLDGTVVQGGFAGIADVTITPATATANAALPIEATGTLGLVSGSYDNLTLRLDPDAAVDGTVALQAGRLVVLGANAQVAGGNGAPVAGVTTVLGGGTLANQGTIELVPASSLESVTVYEPAGKFHSLVGSELDWTQTVAPTLDVTAARFVNTGLVALAGGTLDFSGAGVRNTGVIRLVDASAETPQQSADGLVSVVSTTLATTVEIEASVTDFFNSGTINADTVQFDGAISLARLGTILGDLEFAGTLDLGGHTLTGDSVSVTGTVQHGSLGGGVALAGATLAGVTLAGTAQASGTLGLLGLGALTIRAGATLAVAASATLAGGSGAVLVDNGTIVAESGATANLQAGVGGTGVVELAANAVVEVGSLALFARPTFLFDPGASFLALPGSGGGVTLADLHAGDVLDFTGVASAPASTQARAFEVGDTLHVIGASGQSALVALHMPAAGLSFAVSADGHGGSLVTVG